MGVATEILSLRQNKSSRVETLLSMLDWQKSAQDYEHIRLFLVSTEVYLLPFHISVIGRNLILFLIPATGTREVPKAREELGRNRRPGAFERLRRGSRR